MVATPMTTPAKSKSAKTAPSKTQATKRSVGQILKSRRQDKNYTLKQVEVATRIRGKYLVAIEADDHAALPPDAYARGFVHSYAEYLGMDGTKVSARYQHEAGDSEVQLAGQRGS
jgi:cytoskeleton protein RodZ